jgi:hypothetical protein
LDIITILAHIDVGMAAVANVVRPAFESVIECRGAAVNVLDAEHAVGINSLTTTLQLTGDVTLQSDIQISACCDRFLSWLLNPNHLLLDTLTEISHEFEWPLSFTPTALVGFDHLVTHWNFGCSAAALTLKPRMG